MKTIKLKNRTKINYNDDGNIWHIHDKSGGPLIGKVYNHVCNIYGIYSFHQGDVEKRKLIPVDKLLLKYGVRFKIRKLRFEYTKRIDTDYGPRLIVTYGYLSKDRFEYLLNNRKVKAIPNTDYGKAVMLKRKDFKFREY